jgi:hypothetical protein
MTQKNHSLQQKISYSLLLIFSYIKIQRIAHENDNFVTQKSHTNKLVSEKLKPLTKIDIFLQLWL